MFVLCVETKHCQVACGFDSDSCTYKTTEPNALKHWLCVPITCLSSQSSILLHPVLAFCNLYYKSEKDMLIVIIVWQKKKNPQISFCVIVWGQISDLDKFTGPKHYSLFWIYVIICIITVAKLQNYMLMPNVVRQ